VLKYFKRFQERAKEPRRVKRISEKNILVMIQEGGHFGEAGIEQGLKEKSTLMAFLDYTVISVNNEIIRN